MRQAYIAGCYSGPDESIITQNIGCALLVASYVNVAGWFPIVPHTMGSHRTTWNAAMDRCRGIIRGLDPAHDAIVLVDNWEKSKGAREEVDLAKSLGIPVLTVAEAMVLALRGEVA